MGSFFLHKGGIDLDQELEEQREVLNAFEQQRDRAVEQEEQQLPVQQEDLQQEPRGHPPTRSRGGRGPCVRRLYRDNGGPASAWNDHPTTPQEEDPATRPPRVISLVQVVVAPDEEGGASQEKLSQELQSLCEEMEQSFTTFTTDGDNIGSAGGVHHRDQDSSRANGDNSPRGGEDESDGIVSLLDQADSV